MSDLLLQTEFLFPESIFCRILVEDIVKKQNDNQKSLVQKPRIETFFQRRQKTCLRQIQSFASAAIGHNAQQLKQIGLKLRKIPFSGQSLAIQGALPFPFSDTAAPD